jgi:hypothetical protein
LEYREGEKDFVETVNKGEKFLSLDGILEVG